jgi:integrase
LLDAIDKDSNQQVADLMKLALFTGMRRGELFKLRWKDIDFERGFINIRNPKGGSDQVIPMNEPARCLLTLHEKTESPYVFPGQGGKQRVTAQIAVNRIKKQAGLPKDFRPLHGLRHTYASMLASSGKVDMIYPAEASYPQEPADDTTICSPERRGIEESQ